MARMTIPKGRHVRIGGLSIVLSKDIEIEGSCVNVDTLPEKEKEIPTHIKGITVPIEEALLAVLDGVAERIGGIVMERLSSSELEDALIPVLERLGVRIP